MGRYRFLEQAFSRPLKDSQAVLIRWQPVSPAVVFDEVAHFLVGALHEQAQQGAAFSLRERDDVQHLLPRRRLRRAFVDLGRDDALVRSHGECSSKI